MIPIDFQVTCSKVKVKPLFWTQCLVHFIYFNPLLTCFGKVLLLQRRYTWILHHGGHIYFWNISCSCWKEYLPKNHCTIIDLKVIVYTVKIDFANNISVSFILVLKSWQNMKNKNIGDFLFIRWELHSRMRYVVLYYWLACVWIFSLNRLKTHIKPPFLYLCTS